jgi:hypothetical protein
MYGCDEAMRQAELAATSLTGNEICGNRHSESIFRYKAEIRLYHFRERERGEGVPYSRLSVEPMQVIEMHACV